MEKGQLRCDCNISVRPEGQTELGTKIEIKNMNSISGVRRAVAYEIVTLFGARELWSGFKLAEDPTRTGVLWARVAVEGGVGYLLAGNRVGDMMHPLGEPEFAGAELA